MQLVDRMLRPMLISELRGKGAIRYYSGLQKFVENAKTNFTPWELPERTPEVTLDTFGSM